jgi:hypothetical protein
MQQYSYDLVNGYPIASIRGRKFLIDTSIPYTIADRPMVLEGQRFEVFPEVTGLTTANMGSVVGIELDGVLGANVTDQFVLKIRPEQQTLVLDQYLDAFPLEIPVDNLGGLAIMHQTIAGKRVKAFLSLGTRLSYISADSVEGLEPIGKVRDIMGMIGEFETEVYQLSVAVGRDVHDFNFGVIPAQMQNYFDMANVQAAIGSELLQHYALDLSMDDGVLMLDPLQQTRH